MNSVLNQNQGVDSEGYCHIQFSSQVVIALIQPILIIYSLLGP